MVALADLRLLENAGDQNESVCSALSTLVSVGRSLLAEYFAARRETTIQFNDAFHCVLAPFATSDNASYVVFEVAKYPCMAH